MVDRIALGVFVLTAIPAITYGLWLLVLEIFWPPPHE